MTAYLLTTYLAQTTLAVSILLAFVLFIRRPFAKAFGTKAVYALWAIPFLRLILPPLPTNLTLLGWLQTLSGFPADLFKGHVDMADPVATGFMGHAISETTNPLPLIAQPTPFSPSELLQTFSPFLLGLWAAGFLLILSLTVSRQLAAARLIRAENHAPSKTVLTLARQIEHAIGLRHERLDLKTSSVSSGPLVCGLLKPTLLLPEWFETDYTHKEQGVALAHEMLHIKRGDLWGLHAAVIALAMQWFNPLAWLSIKVFRIDQEAACDADVLALWDTCPHTYGATLIKAARLTYPITQPLKTASLPLSHALYERLNIMKNPLPSARQRLTSSFLTASVGVAALLASACAASSAQTSELKSEPETTQSDVEMSSVFINDEDGKDKITVLRNGEVILLEDLKGLSSFAKLEGLKVMGGLEALGALEDTDGQAIFVKVDNDKPDAEAFAAQVRKLATNPSAKKAEIEAFAADFEARMQDWSQSSIANLERRLVKLNTDSESTWIGKFEASECEREVRTVIVKRNDAAGIEEKIVNVTCGAALMDTDSIVANLREHGDLSEDRLAEITAKLKEADGKVNRMTFQFETDSDDAEN